jgi:hypothetical protein
MNCGGAVDALTYLISPHQQQPTPATNQQVNYMASDLVGAGGGPTGAEDESTTEAQALAREADAMRRKEREATGHLGGSMVPASGAGGVAGTKRKGGAELEALDREAKRIQSAVPAEQLAAASASVAAASNPEEIDLDDMEEEPAAAAGGEEEEVHVEGDRNFGVKAKAIPAAVLARAGFGGGDGEDGDGVEGGHRVGALERLRGKK